jgi:ion channel-forming bestrophin family protein
MILRKSFRLSAIFQYMWLEIGLSLAFALLAQVQVFFLGDAPIRFPFSVAAIMGSALAIFIAFRNNNAYARWWEARTLWGGIINSSRVFGRLCITFSESHKNQPNYDPLRAKQFQRQLLFAQIGWVHALRLQLRGQNDPEQLQKWLPSEPYPTLTTSQNKPNAIQLAMGRDIYDAMGNGTLGGFDSFQLEGQLLALANYQGSCERIKNTPLLRQYHFFTRLFLFAFIAFLPFCLVADFQKMDIQMGLIPVSMVISFVFSVMAKVGEINEDPFENRITDVPLLALCTTIERDLLEMLGEPLPEKIQPADGHLF